MTFNPQGEIIAKHRKAHLFDIDIPNGITFQESLTLSGGDKATVFKLGEYGNVGLGICYDIRFPELASIASRYPYNSFAMFYPGAFNTTTGPLHWHLLARARAVDNETFVVLCSPARDVEGGGYQAYGHSLVADPFGNIIAELEKEKKYCMPNWTRLCCPKPEMGFQYTIKEDLTSMVILLVRERQK